MRPRLDCSRAPLTTPSGMYRYHGDPEKFVIKLIIEKIGPDEHGVPIGISQHGDVMKETTHSPLLTTNGDDHKGDKNKSSISSSAFDNQDKLIQYIIRWDSMNPLVEKILSTDYGSIPPKFSDSLITKDYRIVAKLMHYNQQQYLKSSPHHGQQSSYNYSLHQPVKWNNPHLSEPSALSMYNNVSPKFYNHHQNSILSQNNITAITDTTATTNDNNNKNVSRGTHGNNSIIVDHNNQASTNNSKSSRTMYILLERKLGPSILIDVDRQSSQALLESSLSRSNTQQTSEVPIQQPETNISASNQHVLGLITLDEQNRLVAVKPDFNKQISMTGSCGYDFPKFTYWFEMVNLDENGAVCVNNMKTASSIHLFESEINLTRSILRPQLNLDYHQSGRPKKVFSSPINGSVLTYIHLEIQYAHSLRLKSLDNLYVRYRLFKAPLEDEGRGELDSFRVSTNPNINPVGVKPRNNDSELLEKLYLDSKTVTSLPNSNGRYHFSCVEQFLIESKRNKKKNYLNTKKNKIVNDNDSNDNNNLHHHDQQQQNQDTHREQKLNLLMEFYSGDFFREKFEGWAFVMLPKPCSKKIVEIDIINYDLYRITDRIRYQLLGTMPGGMADIKNVVLAKNKYLLPTLFSGKVVLSYEAVQQVSDRDLDQATMELLKISDIETRMVKIDIESVIQAYKVARKKLEALEC